MYWGSSLKATHFERNSSALGKTPLAFSFCFTVSREQPVLWVPGTSRPPRPAEGSTATIQAPPCQGQTCTIPWRRAVDRRGVRSFGAHPRRTNASYPARPLRKVQCNQMDAREAKQLRSTQKRETSALPRKEALHEPASRQT